MTIIMRPHKNAAYIIKAFSFFSCFAVGGLLPPILVIMTVLRDGVTQNQPYPTWGSI